MIDNKNEIRNIKTKNLFVLYMNRHHGIEWYKKITISHLGKQLHVACENDNDV